MTRGFRNKRSSSNAKAPRRVEAGSLGPNLERPASTSCAVRPARLTEGPETSGAEAKIRTDSYPAQILFLLDADQIFGHIPQPYVSQILIVFNPMKNRAPDWHLS